MANLLWHRLAANTREDCPVGQATFAKFAVTNGFVPAFPVQYKALAQFTATTTEETSSNTAQAYVAHLRSYHINLAIPLQYSTTNASGAFFEAPLVNMVKD